MCVNTCMFMESQKLSLLPITCPYDEFLEPVGGLYNMYVQPCTNMILFKLTHAVEHRESDCLCFEYWCYLIKKDGTTQLDIDKEINFG